MDFIFEAGVCDAVNGTAAEGPCRQYAACIDFEFDWTQEWGLEDVRPQPLAIVFGAPGLFVPTQGVYPVDVAVYGRWTISRSSNDGLDCQAVDPDWRTVEPSPA